MKVAFEEFHLWFQFALSLISAGKVSTKKKKEKEENILDRKGLKGTRSFRPMAFLPD